MKTSKGSFYTISQLPGAVSGGVEIGDRVQAISDAIEVGDTSKVKLKFLDRSGEITLDDYCLQPLTRKEANEIDALEQVAGNIPIIYRDPRKLKTHPLNDRIYGADEPIADLLEKVKETGEIHPIIVNQNNEIVSGNRRQKVAIELSWKLVPVIVQKFADDFEEKEALLSYNASRDKTVEQITNETNEWIEIIKHKREKEPQKKGQRRERVRDLACQKSNQKPSSYHRSNSVLKRIEELKKEGEIEQAEKWKTKLNNNPTAAYKEYQEIKKQATQFSHPIGEICQISAGSNSELKAYQGLWGVVVSKNDILGDFMIYDTVLKNVNSFYLKSLNFNELDRKKAKKIMERLYAIGSQDKDAITTDMLQGISRRPNPELTVKEHKLLVTLETTLNEFKSA
ncbi:MAG: ParB N-terminal domain-containing protein [Prochloraceae cyanobacterium]|nr:ParB N-terminal domain-containing protein [Prochloraceae cyanobacterium]